MTPTPASGTIGESWGTTMSDASPTPQPGAIPDPSSPYLTLGEAADFARYKKRTIQRWLAAGKLTRHGHGRRPLIKRQELTDLLSPTPREDAPSAAPTTAEPDA